MREYVEAGIPDSVMAQYQIIQDAKAKRLLLLHENNDGTDTDAHNDTSLQNQVPGPLQQALTLRKGTLTVIAEYKRKLSSCDDDSGSSSSSGGYIADVFDPEILGPVFREFGATGIAVLADFRMGGCTYTDLAEFVEEQRQAAHKVPGPVAVISSDVIIDKVQIAQSAALNVAAIVLALDMVGVDELPALLRAASAVQLEAIVAVSSKQEAQTAVDLVARILSIVNVDGIDDKVACIDSLIVPDGQSVCKIANIQAKNNKQLTEIEEAWAVRDKGFQCAWVGEALYKGGADLTEHPGAIIKAMRSKSSLKWGVAKAKSGRGEGAREYLGDILM